jgi:hypothetical protein
VTSWWINKTPTAASWTAAESFITADRAKGSVKGHALASHRSSVPRCLTTRIPSLITELIR